MLFDTRTPSRGTIFLRYALAVVAVLIGHLIIHLTGRTISPSPHTVYLAVVVVIAYYGGLGPGMLATALAVIDLDSSYMPPYGELVADVDNPLSPGVFLSVSLIISTLQGRRSKAERSLRAAHEDLEHRVIERTSELEESRRQLSVLVEGFSDQAFFMLDPHGKVASWNLGAERLLGFSTNEVIGQPLIRIWPDSSSQGGAESTSTPPFDDRYEHYDWLRRKDNSRFWGSSLLPPWHRRRIRLRVLPWLSVMSPNAEAWNATFSKSANVNANASVMTSTTD